MGYKTTFLHEPSAAVIISQSELRSPWQPLREKCIMAVTESSLDSMVREMSITTLMTVQPLSYACGHGTEMLLILKNIFDLIIARYFEI